MKKFILLSLYLFSINQSFCENNYLELGKFVYNKTIGLCTLGIGIYGTLLSVNFYLDAYNNHCKAIKNHTDAADSPGALLAQEKSAVKKFNKYIQCRNKKSVLGTVILIPTLISLGISYRFFTQK